MKGKRNQISRANNPVAECQRQIDMNRLWFSLYNKSISMDKFFNRNSNKELRLQQILQVKQQIKSLIKAYNLRIQNNSALASLYNLENQIRANSDEDGKFYLTQFIVSCRKKVQK